MSSDVTSLQTSIERLATAGADADRSEAREVFAEFRAALSHGSVLSLIHI